MHIKINENISNGINVYIIDKEYNIGDINQDLNDYLSRGINIPVFCQLCKIQPGLIVKKYLSLPFLRKMCYNDNGIFCNRRKPL